MRLKVLAPLIVVATLFLGCGSETSSVAEDIAAAPTELADPTMAAGSLNALSAAERESGWALLFDGTSTEGWHNYGKSTVGSAWKVRDGVLYLDVSNKKDGRVVGGGDLVTDSSYANYELALEWKIDSCANSGIIYNVVESDDYAYPWQTGPEMQIIDNECHPDAQYPDHRASDLYDLIAVSEETVRPAGEWNQVRLVNRDGKVEHWLNGKQVVTVDMNDPAWAKMIATSKFKDMPAFGRSTEGRIALQDHGDGVYFRNIKIRSLNED